MLPSSVLLLSFDCVCVVGVEWWDQWQRTRYLMSLLFMNARPISRPAGIGGESRTSCDLWLTWHPPAEPYPSDWWVLRNTQVSGRCFMRNLYIVYRSLQKKSNVSKVLHHRNCQWTLQYHEGHPSLTSSAFQSVRTLWKLFIPTQHLHILHRISLSIWIYND